MYLTQIPLVGCEKDQAAPDLGPPAALLNPTLGLRAVVHKVDNR